MLCMKKIRIQPLGENVLVQLGTKETKTAGGLYLPESSSGEREQQGTVMGVGTSKDIHVKKGDIVIFKRYGTSEELKLNGEEYLILNIKDVLAVVLA